MKFRGSWNGPGVTSYDRRFSASLNALFMRWFVIDVSLLRDHSRFAEMARRSAMTFRSPKTCASARPIRSARPSISAQSPGFVQFGR